MQPDVVVGAIGAFEIYRGDDLVYSKLARGEFPDEVAIVAALRG